MTVSVSLKKRVGAFTLDVAFSSSGGLTALFGQSGSGKTSLVNLIAGLMRPDTGHISVNGMVLVDTEKRIFLPTHKRRIGYVFQDARLFPHLTVKQNLYYGRWFAPRSDDAVSVSTVVDLLGIGHLVDRRPAGLSGGEKQRVAIGRALLANPRLILMDEPLAALDEARKAEILPYIERLRDEARIPIIYVSHSVAEVARLADEVVLLSGGRVKAAGPARDVLSRHDLLPESERNEVSALLELAVKDHAAHYGLTLLQGGGAIWHVPQISAAPGTPVRVRVKARDVMLARERPGGVSALNIVEGQVQAIESDDGPHVLVAMACAGTQLFARITRYSLDALKLEAGMPIFAVVKSVSIEGGETYHRLAAKEDRHA